MSEDVLPRLPPLPRDRWDEEVCAALRTGFPAAAERFLSGGSDAPAVPHVLATLLHHPALAGPFLAYNRVLLEKPVLAPRLRELMVLRVAWRKRSPYEWVQHARIAVGLGITADEINAVARGGEAAWSPLESDLLAATDQLLADTRIENATWTRLAAQLDERQLVEVVFVVGTYTCLAMAFNSFGLQLDPGLELPAGVAILEAVDSEGVMS